jgi:hypothetical protein
MRTKLLRQVLMINLRLSVNMNIYLRKLVDFYRSWRRVARAEHGPGAPARPVYY